MEEKKPINIRLSTAVLLFIILILIGVIIYFVLQNNMIQNRQQQSVLDKNTLQNKTEESINIDESANTTTNTTPKTNIAEELIKSLIDENWVENNLRIKKAGNKTISSSDVQKYTFSALNVDTEDPVVIVNVESEENLALQAFVVQYKNNTVVAKALTDEPVHNSHNYYLASDKYVAEMYAHMGNWNYTIYEIKNNELSKVKKDEGTLKEDESDYKELEQIEQQYSLKDINTKLTSVNLNKILIGGVSKTLDPEKQQYVGTYKNNLGETVKIEIYKNGELYFEDFDYYGNNKIDLTRKNKDGAIAIYDNDDKKDSANFQIFIYPVGVNLSLMEYSEEEDTDTGKMTATDANKVRIVYFGGDETTTDSVLYKVD